MTTRSVTRELALRINSALVLIAISLSATIAGPRTFAVLIIIFAMAMSWEWRRVVSGKGFDAIFFLQAAAIALTGVLTLYAYPLPAIFVILAATAAAFTIHNQSQPKSDPWWSAAGVYYAGFPAMALIGIRQDPDYGLAAIIYLFIVVWSTDTGAFFFGRLIGGPKLAPAISPNKTVSGLVGGALCACLAGMAFAVFIGNTSVLVLGLISVALALIAQAGDLGESAIKRFFGVKHSSGLIPGHGGVLDRLDGLVFAALGAGFASALIDPMRPGRALLIW